MGTQCFRMFLERFSWWSYQREADCAGKGDRLARFSDFNLLLLRFHRVIRYHPHLSGRFLDLKLQTLPLASYEVYFP